MRKNSYVWKPVRSSCENVIYAECTIDNSVITCDEFITTTKSILKKTVAIKSTPTKFNENKVICKNKNFLIDYHDIINIS